MPFYLANPRSTAHSGSVQRGTMVASDYIRTEPGRFMYRFATRYNTPFTIMVMGNLASVRRAIANPGVSCDYAGRVYNYLPYATKSLPYIALPQLQVQFMCT